MTAIAKRDAMTRTMICLEWMVAVYSGLSHWSKRVVDVAADTESLVVAKEPGAYGESMGMTW